MAGLKELRTRITAIKSTQKITSAMKMIAASRLHRVQNLVEKNKEYAEILRLSALRVLSAIEQEEKEKNIHYLRPQLLRQKAQPQNYLIYVLSSDRGLCGAYNSNITKKALQRINQLSAAGKNITVHCLGKKSYNILRRKINTDHVQLMLINNDQDLSYTEQAKALSEQLLQQFTDQQFDVCEFVYARFITALNRDFTCQQVCPVLLNKEALDSEQLQNITRIGQAFYDFLPDKSTLLANILPILFDDAIFKALVNAAASEHSARMTSMDSATRNAKKMIDELTLKYNSLRQSAITTELIEIIAGAEAI